MIRALFSCVAAYGHFHPLVPLARAFAEDGHEVTFATSESFRPRVEEAGFELLSAGLSQDDLERAFAPYRARVREMPIPARRPYAFGWRFATLEAPGKIAALRDAVERWQPDVVIHESADLAAPLVTRVLGVASVHHAFGRMVPAACFARAAAEIEPLWRAAGVEPEPACGSFRGLYVDIAPPSFQTGSPPAGTPVQLEQPRFPPPPGAVPPAWLEKLSARPLVYVTLGTVLTAVETFRVLLDGLAELDVTVVMTVGRDNDPAELGPLPPNAIVERYVPQEFVLPRAAVVAAHGGSGSILATFAHGLPTLLVPQGADQFENAARCAELGAGLVLMPGHVSAASVRAAVETLLADASYRDRARALAAEIASMPSPSEVVARIVGRPGGP